MLNGTSLKLIVDSLVSANLLDQRFIPYQKDCFLNFSSHEQVAELIQNNKERFSEQERILREKTQLEIDSIQRHAFGVTFNKSPRASTEVVKPELKTQEHAKKVLIEDFALAKDILIEEDDRPLKTSGLNYSDNREDRYIPQYQSEESKFNEVVDTSNPLDKVQNDYQDLQKSYTANQVLCDLFAFLELPYASKPVFITTDTRRLDKEITENSLVLFIVLDSTKLSKHELASLALARKNTLVLMGNLTERDVDFCFTKHLGSIIPVKDIYLALDFIATLIREQYKPLTVAITGSSGKTSLKEAVTHVCRNYYPNRVIATSGNFNNELGVPITLLDIANQFVTKELATEIAVIEHGANHLGEIYNTTLISKPDIAIINNVQPAHTEGFAGLRGVSLAKAEIFSNLHQEGVKIVNLDSYTNDLMFARKKFQTLLTFSAKNPIADFYINEDSIKFTEEQTSFDLHINGFECKRLHFPRGEQHLASEIFIDPQVVKVRTNLRGKIGVYNATATIAVCLASGIPLDHILFALKNIPIPPRREKVIATERITYVDDSYNANPGSVLASMELLKDKNAKHKFFVLGNLAELDYETKVNFFTEIYDKFIYDTPAFNLISNLKFVEKAPDEVATNQTLYVLPFTLAKKDIYVLETAKVDAPINEATYFIFAQELFNLFTNLKSKDHLAITFKGSNSSKMNLCFMEFLKLLKQNLSAEEYTSCTNNELHNYLKVNYNFDL
ncbi:Mur ligase family protein [Psittacicella gerlachiana]|uniref:Mur ligase central domain-containing protein n=1 Tax=Psittacicella gerlachiana TaxID=2028574 RepID=A0A3A1YI89_9GAMM|nr:UDP-N-acetylmuramoyl-tripeptide--D-alanyl-D-alanine ligase [Psittacicella gerlachiana]RIY37872.1 hypothetical protein CKF59_01310 [Psittacicella gerlachiana]